MTEQPSEPAARDVERRPALPRHLAALAGVLQGPSDLGANHDAYLTFAAAEDRADGAASA